MTILGASSLHPKFPFPAAVVERKVGPHGWVLGLRSLLPKIPFPATEFGTATNQPAFGNRPPRRQLREASKPIADSIRGFRTVVPIPPERREAARHRCPGANDLLPRL